VSVRDSETATDAIRRALGERSIHIRRLEAIAPSMEDIFVATIEEEERKTK
jgi:ABC-type uncharacterized transport system ATPase subunit